MAAGRDGCTSGRVSSPSGVFARHGCAVSSPACRSAPLSRPAIEGLFGMNPPIVSPSREALLGRLYEAAELEHNLMCTYLYAAFSLRSGEDEGLSKAETEAVARWRRTILDVAIDE